MPAVTNDGAVTVTSAAVPAGAVLKAGIAETNAGAMYIVDVNGPQTTATTQPPGDNSTKISTTAFVTTAVANAIAGVNPAVAVLAATTAAGDTSGLTYVNGAAGIGATLTGAVNTAVTIDGVAFTAVGQRLLVKNDTQSPAGAFNGVYAMSVLQTIALAPVFVRASDYNQPSDINNTGAIPVVSGTANALTSWLLTSAVTTIGTDALTYAKFSVNPSGVATLWANTFTGNQKFVETTDTVYGITDGAAFEIDPTNGNIQTITLGASRTPAATNFAAGQCILLGIDDGTAYAITWTSVAVTWIISGGTATAPALATTGYTWILLWKVGSTIYGTLVGSP